MVTSPLPRPWILACHKLTLFVPAQVIPMYLSQYQEATKDVKHKYFEFIIKSRSKYSGAYGYLYLYCILV